MATGTEGGGGGIGGNRSVTVINTLFQGNYAGKEGGGLNIDDVPETVPAVVKVVNCQFVNDQCVKYGGRVYAKDGGVGSSVTLINCLFNGELATDSTASDGGGVWLEGINLTMKDCTVVHCNAGHGEGGGLVTYPTGSGTVTNCLFFENHAGGFADSDDIGDNTSMTISYCAMQVLPTGGGDYSVGNIVFGTGETPHFVNDSLGNFHLTCGSRCVNTGHNSTNVTLITAKSRIRRTGIPRCCPTPTAANTPARAPQHHRPVAPHPLRTRRPLSLQQAFRPGLCASA